MNNFQLFTDKDHRFARQEIFGALKMSQATVFNVSPKANTGFLGFGVAITGSSCYNLSLMKASDRKKFLKDIYSRDGLGLSVGRLSIGSSDYSAELYSYDDVPFDTSLEHFSVERDEKYIIPMIKEMLEVNPDIFLFASPWSPPAWMKTGGNICGGYMRAKYVECYAEYVVKYIKAYAAHGIKISAITPQNEPNTQQGGNMPACIWHPEIEAEFIKALRKKLDESSLDVKIWMHDHNFYDKGRVLWELENCEGLCESCDGVAFHYYKGTVEETKIVKETYPDLSLHFTEGGPRLYDSYDTDWCKWSIMILKCLACGYSSFTGWNLMLNEMGGPNIGPFYCGGLVTRNSESGELSYSGQYKALSHIAPYITPNSEIYALEAENDYGCGMSGYPKNNMSVIGVLIDNHDGKKVIIAVNPNADKCQAEFCVDGKLFYCELTPDSVSTIILQ